MERWGVGGGGGVGQNMGGFVKSTSSIFPVFIQSSELPIPGRKAA